jgi:DNA-binding beta-propeller fold protein YncE
MVYIVLLFSYYPLVTSNRKAVLLWFTTSNLLVNLSTTQWEFKDSRVLECPRGISVDNDGNVYVVGYSTNNVVVISPDGQRHRQPHLILHHLYSNILFYL